MSPCPCSCDQASDSLGAPSSTMGVTRVLLAECGSRPLVLPAAAGPEGCWPGTTAEESQGLVGTSQAYPALLLEVGALLTDTVLVKAFRGSFPDHVCSLGSSETVLMASVSSCVQAEWTPQTCRAAQPPSKLLCSLRKRPAASGHSPGGPEVHGAMSAWGANVTFFLQAVCPRPPSSLGCLPWSMVDCRC